MHKKRKPTPHVAPPPPIADPSAVPKDVAARSPIGEDAHWREHYASRPYVKSGAAYADYQPAYRFGWEGRGRYGELNWEAAEPRLREDWQRTGKAGVDWAQASSAARDAFERLRGEYAKDNI